MIISQLKTSRKKSTDCTNESFKKVEKRFKKKRLKANVSEEKLSLMPCLRTLSNVLF